MAPHVVYSEASCPHPGCDHPMQAIDFRLEDRGKAVHDPLVTAWWDDTGFAGRCPNCGGNLVPRPIRPAAHLEKYPASAKRVHSSNDECGLRARKQAGYSTGP